MRWEDVCGRQGVNTETQCSPGKAMPAVNCWSGSGARHKGWTCASSAVCPGFVHTADGLMVVISEEMAGGSTLPFHLSPCMVIMYYWSTGSFAGTRCSQSAVIPPQGAWHRWCFSGCGKGTRGIKPLSPCRSDLMVERLRHGEEGDQGL